MTSLFQVHQPNLLFKSCCSHNLFFIVSKPLKIKKKLYLNSYYTKIAKFAAMLKHNHIGRQIPIMESYNDIMN